MVEIEAVLKQIKASKDYCWYEFMRCNEAIAKKYISGTTDYADKTGDSKKLDKMVDDIVRMYDTFGKKDYLPDAYKQALLAYYKAWVAVIDAYRQSLKGTE